MFGASQFGDHDGDGDIDLADHTAFVSCMTGPGGSLPTGCGVFDFEGDHDVDMADFAMLQAVFTGQQ